MPVVASSVIRGLIINNSFGQANRSDYGVHELLTDAGYSSLKGLPVSASSSDAS